MVQQRMFRIISAKEKAKLQLLRDPREKNEELKLVIYSFGG
jgi:hypothetical protein